MFTDREDADAEANLPARADGAPAGRAAQPSRLRVLFLATYFPKPGNLFMGPWALAQARALARQDVDLRVLSFTSWVPRPLARFGRAAHWAQCPPSHNWDGLQVHYPRWLLYQVGPLKAQAYRSPSVQHELAWLSARRRLDRVERDFKPDVVYAHNTWTNGYVAEKLRRRHSLPYVITDHGFDEIVDCERMPKRRAVLDRVMSGAFGVVAISRRMEQDIRRLFPRVRVELIHNGVDVVPAAMWETPRPAALAARRIIYSAGGLYPLKGFPVLVEAFARVAGRHPDAILRIAGEGAQKEFIEGMIRDKGLQDRVVLTGAQPYAQVRQEMVWADVFALLSCNDLFPTVILEAMSAGTPIVCTTDTGIVDVVKDSVHGYLVPPHNPEAAAGALDRLLCDDAARAAMGARGRSLIESTLTWDAHARLMVDLLRRAAASSGRANSSAPDADATLHPSSSSSARASSSC